MEELYGVEYPVISCSSEVVGFNDNISSRSNEHDSDFVFHSPVNDNNNFFRFEIEANLIKTQIQNHPRYPDLVAAFIDCQKVGAPPEMGYVLEKTNIESFSVSCCSEFGADTELDYFMELYCEILHRYKEELSKTFNEATAFLSRIESQLYDLCKESLTLSSMDCRRSVSETLGVRSADEVLKEMLLRKYSGYLSSLRKEFLHKRKRGKLPKDSRALLMDWWNSHYCWPYPTEEEKQILSEETGLDQKQINNWFINQRKRHWIPSEDVRSALTQTVRTAG